MAEITESDLNDWKKDIEILVDVLKQSFESSEARYYIDDMNEILYIELKGLNEYGANEIEEIAAPVLDELDLDFEDIILLSIG